MQCEKAKCEKAHRIQYFNISKSFSTLLLAGAIVELLNTAQI
jgi:hypothetical protein